MQLVQHLLEIWEYKPSEKTKIKIKIPSYN